MAVSFAIDCERCREGTYRDVNGIEWRCAFCGGTGRTLRVIEPRALRGGMSVETQERAIELYTSGATIAEAAGQLFVSPTSIKNVLRAYDVPRRPRGGSQPYLSAESLRRTTELYGRGLSSSEVARELGLASHTTVLRRLKRAGGPTRSASQALRVMYARRRRGDPAGRGAS